MTGPEGAFYSALDADSEGVEGKFYVWSRRRAARGPRRRRRRGDRLVRRERAAATSRARTSSSRAVAEPAPEVRERIRGALMARRAERIRPGLDDKRLTAWNALMIGALAEAGAVLERDDYLAAARRAAAFVLDEMRSERRPPAAHLQRRRGEAQRLPRGPRVPARGVADALRGDLRGALVSCCARARRHDDRALRRPRPAAASSRPPATTSSSSRGARRSTTRRSRRASRAPRSACCGSPRSPARRATRRPRSASCSSSATCCAARRWRSGTSCRRWTSTSRRRRRSRSSAPTRARCGASCARASAPTSCSPAATARTPPAYRCSRAALRSTAAPRPTSASGSPASDRSPSRRSCRRCSTLVNLNGRADAVEVRDGLAAHRARRPPAKVVVAVHLAAGDRRLVRGEPAREVHRRREERVDLVPARRRRVDGGARRERALPGRRARAAGHRLSPRRRPDERRQSAGSPPTARALNELELRATSPFARAAAVARRDRGDRAGEHHRRRRGRHDPRPGRRGPRARQRPRRRPGGQGHRAGRLRGRPDQGLRGHQRRAARRRAAARARPAGADLPQPGVPLDPAAGDHLRRARRRARSATA